MKHILRYKTLLILLSLNTITFADSVEDRLNKLDSSVTTIDLSNMGIKRVTPKLATFTSVINLNLSKNNLIEFPSNILLELSKLQNLAISMSLKDEGIPNRNKTNNPAYHNYEKIEVKQGINNSTVIHNHYPERKLYYTVDLDPCIALIIVQDDQVLFSHIDNINGNKPGSLTLKEFLNNNLKADDLKNTDVYLVGANSPGSAGQVLKVLALLKLYGLSDKISMASLGNNFTSVFIDLEDKAVFIGRE